MSIILIAILILIIIIVCAFIHLCNNLENLRNRVENSYSQIDVQLKGRNDLILNLVETVKGYVGNFKEVEFFKTRADERKCCRLNFNKEGTYEQ